MSRCDLYHKFIDRLNSCEWLRELTPTQLIKLHERAIADLKEVRREDRGFAAEEARRDRKIKAAAPADGREGER